MAENGEAKNEGGEYEPDNCNAEGNQMQMFFNRFINTIILYQVSDLGANGNCIKLIDRLRPGLR